MSKITSLALVALAFTLPAQAQDRSAEEILRRTEAARPSLAEMAVYQHDWTATLSQATKRAAKEKRPIFFIGNTNITGPTNFYSGHC